MKTNLICWFPESFYLNNTYKNYLVDNNICPLLDSRYSQAIWEQEGKPETLREVNYNIENTQSYKDEPFSVIDGEDSEEWVKQTVAKYPNVTMGESSTEDIQRLIECGCKNITFTAYGWHLFRLTLPKWLGGYAFNIRMPFTSQLLTWKYLEKKYNVRKDLPPYQLRGETFQEAVKRVWYANKFKFVWIMLDQDKYWEKLVTWALAHNKTIGLVAPDKHKNNPEWVYKQLQKFVEVLTDLRTI